MQQHSMNGSINAMVTDANEEILDEMMVVATAYRKAQDSDIMTTTDVTSKARSQADVNHLNYYVVSMPWFRTLSRILNLMQPLLPIAIVADDAASWKEKVGPIINANLIAATGTLRKPPQFLDELRKKSHLAPPSHHVGVQMNGGGGSSNSNSSHTTEVVATHFHHAVDYVLVGSNVWLLLSLKFGHDVELPVPCVYIPRTEDSDSTITSVRVQVNDQDCVPILSTGRFPYEQYFAELVTPSPLPSRLPSAPPYAVVPNDDDDIHPAVMDAAKSDDDNSDDLFPGIEESPESVASNSTNQLVPKNNDIIYLPASNTTKARANDDHWNLNQNDNTDHYESETQTRMVRRRYGSGLGNLGNTCFMNSTLQCLAHTEPLQQYFLSGAYIPDLNRDNPLGSGGELATQFAQLLADMWCSKQIVRNGYASEPASLYTSATNVVYPRSFKFTLGKHAEQFMGYDQHDSQELATYLLDALHEDCNRVTDKPYIEKPEQTQDETDQEASDKAWDLHLKREDSRVLENFMGQVKSRVQCCKPECGRVSTTFDPFMFLSVPIPGTEERTIPITFVPLDPMMRPKKLSVVVNKVASVEEMLKKILDMLPSAGCLSDSFPAPALEDLIVCDVFKMDIFSFLELESEVDKIRESDTTFVYQVRPKREVRQMAAVINESISSNETDFLKMMDCRDTKRSKKSQLDVETLTRLNKKGTWAIEILHYTQNPTYITQNIPAGKIDPDRAAKVYLSLRKFLDQCYLAVEGCDDSAGQKRTRSDTIEASGIADADDVADTTLDTDASDFVVKELIDRCNQSNIFKNVTSWRDLAILEFLAGKMSQEIQERVGEMKQQQEKAALLDGMIIECRIRSDHRFGGSPFLLRIPCNMTVYGLRAELALRLSRCLKRSDNCSTDDRMPSSIGDADSDSTEPPELLLLRAVPLFYHGKNVTNGGFDNLIQLGNISPPSYSSYNYHHNVRDHDKDRAQPSRSEEQQIVSHFVRERSQVCVDLTVDIFDIDEYQRVDDEQRAGSHPKTTITVLDCIEKFCQMEQLEESEQWYCSRCQAHVCAWKQFHIYRSPPHLIVHLKRFQFSARTHRRQKIGVHVDFPLVGLDLTNQVLHWTDDEKPIYDCYAVSNHYGGLGGGHYTAYALNDGGVWCHYDDSRITSNVDASEVVSQAAYVLFYRRRDVPVGQDFEMTVPTPELVVKPAVIIQDAPVIEFGGIGSGNLHRERTGSEISSNVAMIDDEEAMEEDVTDLASRSTSPASDDAVRNDYSGYSCADFRTADEQDDDGDSSAQNSVNKATCSLPLQ